MKDNRSVVMVDVREAAGLASRTPETIRRWVWSGRLEARRQGRRLLVARDDVLRLSGQPANSGPELTLREWATQARRSRGAQGGGAKTASDLVLADRDARSADGGARDARSADGGSRDARSAGGGARDARR